MDCNEVNAIAKQTLANHPAAPAFNLLSAIPRKKSELETTGSSNVFIGAAGLGTISPQVTRKNYTTLEFTFQNLSQITVVYSVVYDVTPILTGEAAKKAEDGFYIPPETLRPWDWESGSKEQRSTECPPGYKTMVEFDWRLDWKEYSIMIKSFNVYHGNGDCCRIDVNKSYPRESIFQKDLLSISDEAN